MIPDDFVIFPQSLTSNESVLEQMSSSSSSVDFNFTAPCNDINEFDSKLVLGGVYIILVTVGLLGNAMVIAMVLRVMCSKGLVTNVYIYVICLSSVDFAYLATGPFLISYMITGTWIFGKAICHIVYICEGLNKTMSIYLLVVLSGDRYLAACRPTTSSRYRSVKAAIIAIIALSVGVSLSNIPIYLYTEVKPSPHLPNCYQCGIWFPMINGGGGGGGSKLPSSRLPNNSTLNIDLTLSEQKTNITLNLLWISSNSSFNDHGAIEPAGTWTHLGSYYTLFLITVYYLLPAALILLFYSQIIKRLRQQYRLIRKKSTKRNKVTKSVLAVISFYFICWTPYWFLQSIITFFPHIQYSSAEVMNVFVYLATSIYTLPYVNSCIDPILYAFLNKHLWVAYAASTRRRMKRNGKLPPASFSESAAQAPYPISNGASPAHHVKVPLVGKCRQISQTLTIAEEDQERRDSESQSCVEGYLENTTMLMASDSFGSKRLLNFQQQTSC